MGESTRRQRDGMSDQALIEGTGADWATWLQLLDERDASSLDHAAIARLLVREFRIDGWWAQSITVGYEQERGLRAPGQRADGTFSATASKTVPLTVAAAFEWVADPDRHRSWTGGLELSQRSASPPTSVRFDASDGSRVQIYLAAKGETTTAVQVEVMKLDSPETAETAKASWRERLARLAAAIHQ